MSKKIVDTEKASHYRNIEQMSVSEILESIHAEDQKVATAVGKVLPSIERFVQALVPRVEKGGRLFYIGSGTSGRLGILDASECPPTFGVPDDIVIGLIAGGDAAIRKAKEFAEDDLKGAWRDLQKYRVDKKDTVLGIAASGRTPYVVGGLKEAQAHGCLTASLTCVSEAAADDWADHRINIPVGPEFITGSTRMKAGTGQKMALNMISTALMVRLGRIKDHRMVDMQLANNKLIDRGARMIQEELGVSYEEAHKLLLKHGSVRKALIEGRYEDLS